ASEPLQRWPGVSVVPRRSSPQRSGKTSTFFLIRYQTAVATVKAINLARQLFRKSRFIVSWCGVRFRQSVVLAILRLIEFAHQQLGEALFELPRLKSPFDFPPVT